MHTYCINSSRCLRKNRRRSKGEPRIKHIPNICERSTEFGNLIIDTSERMSNDSLWLIFSSRCYFVQRNMPRTSKVASSIFLNEIPTFYCLHQHLFDNILKNRMVLQFVCGVNKRVGVLHRREETQNLLVSSLLGFGPSDRIVIYHGKRPERSKLTHLHSCRKHPPR